MKYTQKERGGRQSRYIRDIIRNMPKKSNTPIVKSQKKEKKVEAIFEYLMNKNFLKLMIDINTKNTEPTALRTSSNPKIISQRKLDLYTSWSNS